LIERPESQLLTVHVSYAESGTYYYLLKLL